MILKNKTTHMQSLHLSDGSVVVARPYRTITVNDKINNLNSDVWEIVGETKKKNKENKE